MYLQIDKERRVVEFAEKPKGDALKAMRVDTTVLGLSKAEAEKKPYIASMGIYVFKKGVLGRCTGAEAHTHIFEQHPSTPVQPQQQR